MAWQGMGKAKQSDQRVGVPLVSMTARSVSLARHSTDTAASDTPLGDRVWIIAGGGRKRAGEEEKR